MRRPFSLSPRLQAVANLVPASTRLVDVGTDHGRLPVWLVQHGGIANAVATDLRSGPLSSGQALAQRWNVSDRISFRLCDGLSLVTSAEAETITITGMGGETIVDILSAAPWVLDCDRCFIFQAMSGMDALRRYLSDTGFIIERELLVPEGDTLYVVILAKPGQMEPLTLGEIWVGRQKQGMDAPLRGRYLDQELQKLHRAISGLLRSERPVDAEKLGHYQAAAREVTQIKEEWDQWQL